MSQAQRIPEPMTVAAFMDWAERTPGKWQLIDGVPHAMAATSRTHGALLMRLGGLIGAHLEGTPCSVLSGSGVVPRAFADINARIPDVIVTCTPYETEESLLYDPILLIEIPSPSNAADTWSNVWAYTTIPSVREILIVHTDRVRIDALRRAGDGGWPATPETITGGEITLASIGLTTTLAGLYRTTRFATS